MKEEAIVGIVLYGVAGVFLFGNLMFVTFYGPPYLSGEERYGAGRLFFLFGSFVAGMGVLARFSGRTHPME